MLSAKSVEHVVATKELFGIVVHRGVRVAQTVRDAQMDTDSWPFEDCLVEEFEWLSKRLDELSRR